MDNAIEKLRAEMIERHPELGAWSDDGFVTVYNALRDNAARNSRRNGRRIKGQLLDRDNGKCRVCDLSWTPILIAHHIKPASEFGDGNPDNIITLCPNCHALVHFFRRKYNKCLNNDLNIIMRELPEQMLKRIIDIADQKVQFLDNGSRIVFGCEDYR